MVNNQQGVVLEQPIARVSEVPLFSEVKFESLKGQVAVPRSLKLTRAAAEAVNGDSKHWMSVSDADFISNTESIAKGSKEQIQNYIAMNDERIEATVALIASLSQHIDRVMAMQTEYTTTHIISRMAG